MGGVGAHVGGGIGKQRHKIGNGGWVIDDFERDDGGFAHAGVRVVHHGKERLHAAFVARHAETLRRRHAHARDGIGERANERAGGLGVMGMTQRLDRLEASAGVGGFDLVQGQPLHCPLFIGAKRRAVESRVGFRKRAPASGRPGPCPPATRPARRADAHAP